MPNLQEHCKLSLERYGIDGLELHQWMDEPVVIYGASHRKFRHDSKQVIPETFLKLYSPEIAKNIMLDHIIEDFKSEKMKSERKKEEPKMVMIHGVVLKDERAGRKAEKCRGIHLVDEAGNCLGYIGFEYTEIRLWLDPRISVTMEEGGIDFTRHLSEFRVGNYYYPLKPTTENNEEVISRHREKLLEQEIKINSSSVSGRCYPFTTRSR